MKIILCILGWHRWKYDTEVFSFTDNFGRKTNQEFDIRKCKCCDKKQMFTKRPAFNGVSDNEWMTIN